MRSAGARRAIGALRGPGATDTDNNRLLITKLNGIQNARPDSCARSLWWEVAS